MDFVKIKVSLGYFVLVILASLLIWVTYSEILHYSGEKVDLKPANNKFIYINKILTNLYQAEGLERSYAQTGQKIHYKEYLKLMDTVSLEIDTLALMVNTPIQQMHTDSIKKLLKVKEQSLKELSAIRKRSSVTTHYQQALRKISSVKDSIDPALKVYKNITINRDSVYIKQKKKKFFERLANVFVARNKADSNLHVLTTQSVHVDSLVDVVNPADTIAGLLTAAITEIREDSIVNETRIKLKEQAVFANDQTITLQLRQMLSNIENEELINSFQKVKAQQSRTEKKTELILLVGSFALVTIIISLLNILKDITKSQHYRQRLEKAKIYSESLLKSKEQMMLSLTHDLKSPLSSIIGFTGIMQDDADVSQRHQKYLQNISKSSDQILKLINGLLDLARLETGKLSIDHIPFNLKLLIDDIVEGFRPQAMQKNIDLQFQSNISPVAVYLNDPMRITQIVSNLISNAIKFTDEGKVSIAVSATGSSEKSDLIRMDVVDSGIGISEENTKLIFEEFARVNTASKQYEGTGLGLTITQKLVHLLKGSISLESKPGFGSHFSIVLPLDKGAQVKENPIKLINTQKKGLQTENKGEKIWLIDDDQTLLDMTSFILISAGMEVHAFTDPVKAVSSFYKGCANLLITDIQMPVMNGIELLKQIREKNGGQITAIAVSGSCARENEYDGFSAFIQKPFQPHTLIDVISGQQKRNNLSAVSETRVNNSSKGYNLKQFAAFAEGDPECLRQILESFINTGKQNAILLSQYLQDKNDPALSELSHKMLPLFRQLEADDIVELLARLERKDFPRIFNHDDFLNGKSVLEKIEALLLTIQKEENISV